MACRVERDANNSIVGVYAANGNKSILYSKILSTIDEIESSPTSGSRILYERALKKAGLFETGNFSTAYDRRKEKALYAWSYYLDVFKHLGADSRDINGEPLLDKIYKGKVNVSVLIDHFKPEYNYEPELNDDFLISVNKTMIDKVSKEEAEKHKVPEKLIQDYFYSLLDLEVALGNINFFEYEISEGIYFKWEQALNQRISSLYIDGIRYGIETPEFEFVLETLRKDSKTLEDELISKGVDLSKIKKEVLIDQYNTKLVSETTYAKALTTIRDKSNFPAYRYLAGLMLETTIKDEKLGLVHTHTLPGSHDAITRKIKLSGMIRTQATVHEFLHDYTRVVSNALAIRGVLDDSLTDTQKSFIENLKKIYRAAIDSTRSIRSTPYSEEEYFNHYNYKTEYYKAVGYDGVEHYGLVDISELITEGLTNPEFQKYLSSRKSIGILKEDTNSLFDDLIKLIVDFFTSILNSNKQEDKSLLDDFLYAFSIMAEEINKDVETQSIVDSNNTIKNIMSNDPPANTRLKNAMQSISSQFGVSINYISENSAKQILALHNIELTDDKTAFFLNGEVYLIHERADLGTLVHEVFHPMIEVIAATNRPLFEGLKRQITQEMFDEAKQNVADPNNEDDIYKEAMATFVGDYARSKDVSMIDRVYNHLSKLFTIIKGSKVDINQLTTLQDIANAVLEGTATFNMGEYRFETDKVFFETRKDSPILISVLDRAKKLLKAEDHSKYTHNDTKEEYIPVSSVVDSFTGKEKYDKGISEYLADKYWKNLPPDFKRFTPDFPMKQLTKDQFIKEKTLQMEYAIAKGKIQHMLRQAAFSKSDAERTEILANAQALGNSVGIPNVLQTFGWSIEINKDDYSKSNLVKILTVEGVNIGDEIPEAVKDKMYSEVQVYSDILGWAGTIDSLFEHVDGKFSIIDLTTGNSFNRTEINKLMEFGEQILSITDSPKNRKKLQIMLYAVILKAEHPDIKFRNLKVHWIPDIKEATRKNQDMDIDIQSYLGMIKAYLYNNNRKTYNALISKSPNIFDTSDYSDIGTESIIKVMETEEKGTTLKDIIANEQAALTRLINERDKYIEKHKRPAPYTLEESINKLTKSILDKKALAGMGNPLDVSRPDESMWKKMFGMFGDFADKKLQLFKQFLDERRFASEKEKADLKLQLETITERLRKEYLSKRGSVLSAVGLDNISYSEMYGNMIVTKTISGNLTTQVLIKEGDPGWDNLTSTEKEFVRFISRKMKYYNEKVLKNVAYYTKDNKPVTYLQLVKKTNPNFSLDDASFFPKLQMLQEELREHFPITSKEMASELWKRMQSELFMMNTFTSEDRYGVPLKYYGNAELGDSGHWSRNLEYSFLKFTENLIDKIYMDEPLALGKGLLVLYSTDIGENQKPRQENNMKFLEDRLMLDILNTKEDTPLSRTGIRVPFINKRVNELALFSMLRKLVSSQIMWLKPISGAANGIMANLITQRRAAVTSILGEGAFGLSDTTWAVKEVAAMAADYAKGTLRDNKLFILMKEFNYLPSNFGYNTPAEDLVTAKNKAFSTSNLYITHTFWEQQNALVVLAAQLHRLKTTKNGQQINMYDAYDVVEAVDDLTGTKYKTVKYTADTRGIVMKEGAKEELKGITSEELSKMKRIYQQMQGGYRVDERTTMELYWWGQMMLQFRKYLPSIIMNATKSKSEDYTMGEYKLKRDSQGNIIQEDGKDVYEWVAMQTEGAFRVLFGAGVGFFTNYAVFKEYSWSQLSSQQKQVLVDSTLTLIAGLLMFLAFTALFPDDDDEKDETKLLLMRVLENFTQHYNPLDWLHSLQTPPAALQRTVKGLDASLQLMGAFVNLGLGNEDKAYTRYGRLKGLTEIYKSIPIISSLYAFQKYITKTELTEDTGFGKWMSENIKLAL